MPATEAPQSVRNPREEHGPKFNRERRDLQECNRDGCARDDSRACAVACARPSRERSRGEPRVDVRGAARGAERAAVPDARELGEAHVEPEPAQ